jgi:hypothetical protein
MENTSRILFFKIEKKYHGFLKTFLDDMKMLPKQIPEVDLNLIHADPRIKRLIEKNDK